MDFSLRLLLENGVFVAIATGFLAIAGWAWRDAEPFQLPQPLPGWFNYWFGSVQVLGVLPPLGALIWSWVVGDGAIALVLSAYFVLLALQVLAESLALKRFHSTAWVMVPYLYVPYRLWQLSEGLLVAIGPNDPLWLRLLFVGEIAIWGINYLLDLAQLPRLFQWPGTASDSSN